MKVFAGDKMYALVPTTSLRRAKQHAAAKAAANRAHNSARSHTPTDPFGSHRSARSSGASSGRFGSGAAGAGAGAGAGTTAPGTTRAAQHMHVIARAVASSEDDTDDEDAGLAAMHSMLSASMVNPSFRSSTNSLARTASGRRGASSTANGQPSEQAGVSGLELDRSPASTASDGLSQGSQVHLVTHGDDDELFV